MKLKLLRLRIKKKRLLLWLILSSLTVSIYCGWNIYQEMKPVVQAQQLYNQIRESTFHENATVMEGDKDIMEVNEYTRKAPDFEILTQWNPDIAGWIWSPGTDIDYPIVQ